MTEYAESPTKMVSAANGIDYAFREVGAGDVPLVLLQHFPGNLDNWDPALVDALAPTAPVVTFDNAGVGSSTGTRLRASKRSSASSGREPATATHRRRGRRDSRSTTRCVPGASRITRNSSDSARSRSRCSSRKATAIR